MRKYLNRRSSNWEYSCLNKRTNWMRREEDFWRSVPRFKKTPITKWRSMHLWWKRRRMTNGKRNRNLSFLLSPPKRENLRRSQQNITNSRTHMQVLHINLTRFKINIKYFIKIQRNWSRSKETRISDKPLGRYHQITWLTQIRERYSVSEVGESEEGEEWSRVKL